MSGSRFVRKANRRLAGKHQVKPAFGLRNHHAGRCRSSHPPPRGSSARDTQPARPRRRAELLGTDLSRMARPKQLRSSLGTTANITETEGGLPEIFSVGPSEVCLRGEQVLPGRLLSVSGSRPGVPGRELRLRAAAGQRTNFRHETSQAASQNGPNPPRERSPRSRSLRRFERTAAFAERRRTGELRQLEQSTLGVPRNGQPWPAAGANRVTELVTSVVSERISSPRTAEEYDSLRWV